MPGDAKIHVETASKGAPIWIMGWLFTLGFAQLSFWKGVLAIFIWPYYVGLLLAG